MCTNTCYRSETKRGADPLQMSREWQLFMAGGRRWFGVPIIDYRKLNVYNEGNIRSKRIEGNGRPGNADICRVRLYTLALFWKLEPGQRHVFSRTFTNARIGEQINGTGVNNIGSAAKLRILLTEIETEPNPGTFFWVTCKSTIVPDRNVWNFVEFLIH